MATSRLRPKRVKYKPSEAKNLGWSKGKSLAIIIIMALLIAFMVLIVVGLFLVR